MPHEDGVGVSGSEAPLFSNLVPDLFNREEIENAIAQTNFKKGFGPDLFEGTTLKVNADIKARCVSFL